MRTFTLGLAATFLLVGCAEPEEAPDVDVAPDEPDAPAELTMPDWYELDEANERVTVLLIAGETSANNYWNFNGMVRGEATVQVPVGYEVELTMVNEDPNMAHSVGVGEREDSYPTNFAQVEPIFEGAVTPNPTSLTDSTLPGEEDTITFVADQVGEYDLICYVPGHAQAGMFLHFNVVEDTGDAGVLM